MLKRFDSYREQFKILKPYYRSFGFKILVFIGMVLILLVSINTWYNIHIQEKQLNEEILIAMDNIAQTVKFSTRLHMLENKKEKVQETINYITEKTEGIERIRIFDKNGRIRKTTLSGERGRIIGKTAYQCLICHEEDRAMESAGRDRRIQVMQSDTGGYRVVSLINAIYNEKSCSKNCHEFHPETQKVLGIYEVTMSLKDVDEKITSNRRHLIQFSIILFVAIMISLAAMLFYSLIRPLNALLNGIKNISGGDFSSEIPVYSKDEFGRIAQSLNNMVEKIRKETAYRNLLFFDNITPERQEGDENNQSHSQENVNQTHVKDVPDIHKQNGFGSTLDKQNGFGSTFEEIYERIRDETHMKVVRSVKLASLGQLSAGIAHEINNPLTAVLSYSSLLLDKAKTDKEKQWLGIIVDETKRCRNIVAGLLEFSRQSAPEKVATQVNDIVERAVSLVENKESFFNIKIVKKLDPDLPKLKIDRGQIYQVLTNLIINAGDAMNGKGTLTLESRIHTIESKVAEPRRFVEISVKDTGCGISEKNIERIFDPFFTTKGPTIGTGLGLSICFGIIKRHGGNISVSSKQNEGSTFIVHLPIETENIDGQD
ncbi:HAMP domain-containing protein [bacterium]|nr:HAMP domain-containing protein [bacterium]